MEARVTTLWILNHLFSKVVHVFLIIFFSRDFFVAINHSLGLIFLLSNWKLWLKSTVELEIVLEQTPKQQDACV